MLLIMSLISKLLHGFFGHNFACVVVGEHLVLETLPACRDISMFAMLLMSAYYEFLIVLTLSSFLSHLPLQVKRENGMKHSMSISCCSEAVA